MNKLLILTIEWPYGKGETFLENEVNYISGFDEVHCVPFYQSGDMRSVPANIIISNCVDGRKASIRHAIGGMINCHFWAEVKRLAVEKRLCPQRVRLLVQFSAMANRRLIMLRKWITENLHEDDELTIYTYWMASDAAAVSMLRKHVTIKYYLTRCHGFDLYEYVNPEQYIPYRELTFNGVDKIFPVSAYGKDYLQKQYSTKVDGKVTVARLGTNDWGINAPKNCDPVYQIVSCSNLIPLKRVGLLIDTLHNLSFKAKWDHFGDGVLRDELEQQANDLPDNIEYVFHGRIKNAELMKWYQQNHVDLFINVSESEGIPVSIMEALSMGIPVLATNVGGTGEIVHDGVNGYLMDENVSPDQIAESISKIAGADENQINELRRNARNIWQQEYNAATNYSTFYRKYCVRKEPE